MKTAYVHDWIFHIGWAEQLFWDLIQQDWHDGAIFTLFSDRHEIRIGTKDLRVYVALPRRLNNWFVFCSRRKPPLLHKIFDYRNLIVFYPLLCRLLRRKIQQQGCERLYISSFAAAKNVVSSHWTQQYTILYLHSPMQYIWENYTEYLGKMARRQLLIFKPLSKLLRKRDKKLRHYDQVYCNSEYTAQCAQTYYQLSWQVQYPKLHQVFTDIQASHKVHDYYLYVGRLVKFIRETDLIIKLFNTLELPLLVMWSWPDEADLQALAGPHIVFLGQVTDPLQKAEIIRNAKWVINLAKESCGIATMEALACGTPVFAYGKWGSAELVQPQQGFLTDSKDIEKLIQNFPKFSQQDYDRKRIQQLFWQQYTKHRP